MDVGNTSLCDDFDDISEAMLRLHDDEEITHTLLVAHLARCDEIIEKCLQEALAQKQYLESEVAKTEVKTEIKNRQLEDAKRLIRKERIQNKLKERKNKKIRDELLECVNLMPMNYRKAALEKLSAIEAQPSISNTSDSHLEVELTTDSSMSTTGTSGVSSHTSGQTEDSSDMEQAFSKRISSSTESEGSSILQFPNMMDALKKRQHTFKDRCFILGNKCVICQKKFVCGRIESFCNDCQACVHGRCQDRLAPPCIPTRKLNPRKMLSRTTADFCSPGFRPQIPAFVIHCVLVIERDGLNQQGLYVLPDYSRELSTLKQQLETENSVPNFAQLKTSVVCELLKHFLSASVKPPLISCELYDSIQRLNITKKSVLEDIPKFYDVMLKITEAERATLCFLLLHLKKVCESPQCKVSASSIAKVFAPILLSDFNRNDSYDEKRKKIALIQNMINVPETYYEHILKELF